MEEFTVKSNTLCVTTIDCKLALFNTLLYSVNEKNILRFMDEVSFYKRKHLFLCWPPFQQLYTRIHSQNKYIIFIANQIVVSALCQCAIKQLFGNNLCRMNNVSNNGIFKMHVLLKINVIKN